MSYEWAAKEKQQPSRSWTEWISNIHKAATTTWLGVFMVFFVGVPVNVAAWYMFFWIFPHPTFIGVIVVIWLSLASIAYCFYTLGCVLEKAGQ